MLNPEEKSVLHRAQFIAGLHLVTCKVMGYALPDDLPDELMMSAASVGRIAIPPRPTQGPSSILPGAVLSEPAENPQFQFQQQSRQTQPHQTQPSHQQQQQTYGYQSPMSPTVGHAVGPMPPTSYGSNFMHDYDFSGMGGDNSGPVESIGMAGNQPLKPVDYPQQDQQFFYPPMQQQQWPAMPNADNYRPAPASQPKSASVSKASSLSRSSKSNSNSAANSAEVVPVMPSKPGPHALHDLAVNAPVIMSFESSPPSSTRGPPPTLDSLKTNKPIATSTEVSKKTSGASNGTTTITTVVPRVPSIDYEKLYASPPDAFDHESAPPELDVEGNNIKYRCTSIWLVCCIFDRYCLPLSPRLNELLSFSASN